VRFFEGVCVLTFGGRAWGAARHHYYLMQGKCG